MALPASEVSFIEQIFRPVVNLHVEGYKELGFTLEEAWGKFLLMKPENTSDDTHEIMEKMFNDSWNGV